MVCRPLFDKPWAEPIITTACDATSDDKVVIVTTVSFQWCNGHVLILFSDFILQTVREESGDCDFKEGIVPHFYSTFCSVYHPNASNPHVKRRWLGREWCIGIGKKGQILPGHKSSKNDSTSHFTKRQVKDDSIVWSSITFPIPVTEPVTPSVTAPRNRDRDRDRDSRECEETLPQRPFDRTSSGGMRSRPSNRRKNRRCRKNKKKDRRRSKKKKPCDNLFNVNCENSRRRSKSHRRRNRRRKVNRDGLFDNDARSIRWRE